MEVVRVAGGEGERKGSAFAAVHGRRQRNAPAAVLCPCPQRESQWVGILSKPHPTLLNASALSSVYWFVRDSLVPVSGLDPV